MGQKITRDLAPMPYYVCKGAKLKCSMGSNPNTTTPWLNGKMSFLVKGQPALLDSSKCMCLWAGVIEITDAGQRLMSCGGSAQNAAVPSGNGLMPQGAAVSPLVPAGGDQAAQGTGASTGKIKEIYWSYGEDHRRLSDKSRFYVDLNLHVKTENYKDGDIVSITIKRKDGQLLFGTAQTLDLKGTVSNNEVVFANALKEYTLNLNEEGTERDTFLGT